MRISANQTHATRWLLIGCALALCGCGRSELRVERFKGAADSAPMQAVIVGAAEEKEADVAPLLAHTHTVQIAAGGSQVATIFATLRKHCAADTANACQVFAAQINDGADDEPASALFCFQ